MGNAAGVGACVPPQRFHWGFNNNSKVISHILSDSLTRLAFCKYLAEDLLKNPSKNFFRYFNYLDMFDPPVGCDSFEFIFGENVNDFFQRPNPRVAWLKSSYFSMTDEEKVRALSLLRDSLRRREDALFILCVLSHLGDFRMSPHYFKTYGAIATCDSENSSGAYESKMSEDDPVLELVLKFQAHISHVQEFLSPEIRAELANESITMPLLEKTLLRLHAPFIFLQNNMARYNFEIVSSSPEASAMVGYQTLVGLRSSALSSVYFEADQAEFRRNFTATNIGKSFFPVKKANGEDILDCPITATGLRDSKNYTSHYLIIMNAISSEFNIFSLMLMSDLADSLRSFAVLD